MDFIAANQSGIEFPPKLKILVVDDDVLSQRMMQLLLSRDGHTVDTVSSGLDALNLIKLQKYDVVFMDLQMPGMDGIESTNLIRQWENGGQHTFIVALTASYIPEQGQSLFDAGIDNYIAKPFELEHIQRLLNYSIRAGLTTHSDPLTSSSEQSPSEIILDVEKGVEQVGGDADNYRELLSDFIAELPERLESVEQFFARMDFVGLSRAAHNLNGVAANLGALQLSAYARKLDEQSSAGYTESVQRLLQEIQLIVSELLEKSHKFLAEKKISAESV